MRVSLPKNKKLIFGAGGLLVLLLLALIFMGGEKTPQRPDQSFNMPAFGMLPSLDQAAKDNANIRNLATDLQNYDEAYLFVNYQQVNNKIAALMFYWADIDIATVKRSGGKNATSIFVRRVYAMPDDEPLVGNPLLKNNPWGDLFNEFKVKLLMQGQGHKIYDGLAYYDNETDQMVINADLSKDFINGFAEFLNTQDAATRKKTFNNFLLFIRDTKGFRNLSDKDKELIAKLQEV